MMRPGSAVSSGYSMPPASTPTVAKAADTPISTAKAGKPVASKVTATASNIQSPALST